MILHRKRLLMAIFVVGGAGVLLLSVIAVMKKKGSRATPLAEEDARMDKTKEEDSQAAPAAEEGTSVDKRTAERELGRRARYGDERALPAIREILNAGSNGFRYMVIKELAKIDHPEAVEMLRGIVRNGEESSHLRVSALSALRPYAARPGVMEVLLEKARVNDDFGNMCIDVLGEAGVPVGRQLAELLDTQDSVRFSRKRKIIRALGRIGDEHAVEKLRALAESEDERLANEAIEALGRLGDSDNGEVAVGVLVREGQEDLIPLGDDYASVVASIALACADTSQEAKAASAREAIAVIMGSADRERFVGRLEALTDDEDPDLREAAIATLEYARRIPGTSD